MITEPKQSNSGVPQGAFLKRQVVLKADGTPFVPDDFCIGADTGVYGRQIRIYNTDEYTRKYYQVSLSQFLFILLCPQEFKPFSL
jgi:EF-hand domain-containing protein 1